MKTLVVLLILSTFSLTSQNIVPIVINDLYVGYNTTLGFIDGIEIFSNLTDLHNCIYGDSQITSDITGIIDIIVNLDIVHSDLKQAFQNIILKGEDAYQRMGDLIENKCAAFAAEAWDELLFVEKTVANPQYVAEVLLHGYLNKDKINDMAISVKSSFEAHDWYGMGKGAGQLVNFVLLYSFPTREKLFLYE
jgi:hypothetical protein